jgi:NAD(P)-dependent dehydrogenase (short-subunit alcohol dehydrogenase family)
MSAMTKPSPASLPQPSPPQADAVIITGASTGLGLATAVYLAGKGYRVYATMRNLEGHGPLDEAAGRAGVELHPLQLDITEPAGIARAVEQVVAECGGVYALVNNAGIGLRGYFEDLTFDEIRAVYEANVFGTMAVTQAVLPHMRTAGRGRIVIITSVAGRIASMGLSAYCSSKFAQEGFGESLAQEVLPFGIYVSLVEPAIIKTERWSVNRGTAQGALNPASPYHSWFVASERAADKLVQSSPTKPDDVAERIHQALSAPRPKLRYVVGWRAGLAIALRRYMPGELFERLYFGAAIRRVTRAAASQR